LCCRLNQALKFEVADSRIAERQTGVGTTAKANIQQVIAVDKGCLIENGIGEHTLCHGASQELSVSELIMEKTAERKVASGKGTIDEFTIAEVTAGKFYPFKTTIFEGARFEFGATDQFIDKGDIFEQLHFRLIGRPKMFPLEFERRCPDGIVFFQRFY